MPDEDTSATVNSFDREPSSGSAPAHQQADVSEHADLKHRLEAHPEHTQHGFTNPVRQPAESTVVPEPTQPLTSQPISSADLPHPGPGLLVLQWLTYALWGWTVLALSGLIILVVNQLLSSDDGYSYFWSNSGIAYLLAAVIVLYVIALSCDVFYARAERKHARSNGTNVIMIIHAVLFALFGIGALISSVFGAVRLMIGDTTNSTDTTGAVAGIISGAVIFIVYGLTLLRTLRPRWIKGVATTYWVAMTLLIIGFTIAGVVGPAAQARLKAEDEVIANALPGLAESINEQTTNTGSLPKSLDDVIISDNYGRKDEIRKLIDEDLVKYTPGEKIGMTNDPNDFPESIGKSDFQITTAKPIYHYELCVEYKTSSGYGSDSYDSRYRDVNGQNKYDTSVSTYDHGKGETCYDVQTAYSY